MFIVFQIHETTDSLYTVRHSMKMGITWVERMVIIDENDEVSTSQNTYTCKGDQQRPMKCENIMKVKNDEFNEVNSNTECIYHVYICLSTPEGFTI